MELEGHVEEGKGQHNTFRVLSEHISLLLYLNLIYLYQIVQLLAKHIHPSFGRSLLLRARSLTILILPAMVSKTKSCFGYYMCSQLFISPLLSLPKLQISIGRRDENT